LGFRSIAPPSLTSISLSSFLWTGDGGWDGLLSRQDIVACCRSGGTSLVKILSRRCQARMRGRTLPSARWASLPPTFVQVSTSCLSHFGPASPWTPKAPGRMGHGWCSTRNHYGATGRNRPLGDRLMTETLDIVGEKCCPFCGSVNVTVQNGLVTCRDSGHRFREGAWY
jgi:hypothetical protein